MQRAHIYIYVCMYEKIFYIIVILMIPFFKDSKKKRETSDLISDQLK